MDLTLTKHNRICTERDVVSAIKKSSRDTFIFSDTIGSKWKMQMLKKLYSESVAKTEIEALPCFYSYIGLEGVKCKLMGEKGKKNRGKHTTV